MQPDPSRAMPSLALPIAVVGAVAAMSAVLFFGGSWDAARNAYHPAAPPIAGAAVGLALGLVLDRWRVLANDRPAAALLRVIPALLVAGGLVGALLLIIAGLDGWFARLFVTGGSGAALVFAPSCLVVMRASARAGRARLGSLVAAADRQTVVSTTAAAIAVSTLAAVGAHASQTALARGLIVGVAGVAAHLVLALFLRDHLLARRLERTASSELEAGAAHDDATRARIDVGLGSGAWLAPHRAPAYRSAIRGEVLLRGDVDAARAALKGERNRRLRSLAVVVAVPPSAAALWAAQIAPG